MNLEIPEFTNWQAEAEFWDKTDTTALLEEDGEWVGSGRVKVAENLCRHCGALMERHYVDVTIARGRIFLREVQFYICPRCHARDLPPEQQEFVVWLEKMPLPKMAAA